MALNEGRGVKVLLLGVMTVLTGCAMGSSSSQTASTADLVVTAITPVSGSEVQDSSTVEATVQFTIHDFKFKGNTYYLLTQFGDSTGGSVESERPSIVGSPDSDCGERVTGRHISAVTGLG